MSEALLTPRDEPTESERAVPVIHGRSCPYAPPDAYRTLSGGPAIRRLPIPGGADGWIITRYAEARAMLADPRFSAERRVPSGRPAVQTDSELDALDKFFVVVAKDPPVHTRLRRLTGHLFTVRQVRQMRPTIDRIVADQVDEFEKAGPPADLVSGFTLRLSQQIVDHLLGIPAERRWSPGLMLNANSETAGVLAAIDTVMEYTAELVRDGVGEPGGLLWELAHPATETDTLTEDEIIGFCAAVLLAGHEDNVEVMTLGLAALLDNHAQWEALTADSDLAPQAVEEILRYIAIFQYGINRRALEDVELAGRLIRAGEVVYASVPAANFDPAQFTDPDRFDIHRKSAPHLSFGHGIHQCMAQHLVRNMMVSAISQLPRRFPNMRLAIPVEQLSIFNGFFGGYGPRIPVTWCPDRD